MYDNKKVQANFPTDDPGKATTRWASLKVGSNIYKVAYFYSPTAQKWFVSKVTKSRGNNG